MKEYRRIVPSVSIIPIVRVHCSIDRLQRTGRSVVDRETFGRLAIHWIPNEPFSRSNKSRVSSGFPTLRPAAAMFHFLIAQRRQAEQSRELGDQKFHIIKRFPRVRRAPQRSIYSAPLPRPARIYIRLLLRLVCRRLWFALSTGQIQDVPETVLQPK